MNYFYQYQGEFYALLTAVFWTVTALAFEWASLRVGSLSVNIIRLVFALLLLSLVTGITRQKFLPTDATIHNWVWMSVSGFIGFVLGDLFLFKSYTLIGSRYSMLIMSLVPPLAAFFGFFILGEKLGVMSLVGMAVTLFGISLAIFNRHESKKRIALKIAPRGILYAFAGAVGQALGLVISKYGMAGYNSFAANQIRIITGIVGFAILITVLRHWTKIFSAFKNKSAMAGIGIGAFFGPFLGVSLSLLSIVYTKTGIASTIMSLVPILILPPAIIFFKQKVNMLELIGAIISFIGVSLFFMA